MVICGATKLISNLRNKSYEERLRTLDLLTLKYGRLRGDIFETYKILSGKYVTANVTPPDVMMGNDYVTCLLNFEFFEFTIICSK